VPVFVCKHYRRAGPGAETGTVLNEIRFESDSAAGAETRIMEAFRAPIMPAMDWDKEFAALEDENGHVLATWSHGFLHG
jgi:hypothetical protein